MRAEFGPLLKELRLRAGFGLRKFAQMIDMPAPNLCDIEHGRRNPPAELERLREIAEALGLAERSPDWERFFDAARGGEELPPDVRHLAGRKLVPALLRTIDNRQMSDEDIARLIAETNRMIAFDTFERLLHRLKENFRFGSFVYEDHTTRFRGAVSAHFGNGGGKIYGIYIIRKRDTKEVLYIGKGGTLDGQGKFKGQDMPGRLQNVRGNDIGADRWFRELVQERGALLVEYLVLEAPIAPAYIEASLLQAYLAEHKSLPPKNSSL